MSLKVLISASLLFFSYFSNAQFTLSLNSGTNYNYWKRTNHAVLDPKGQFDGFFSIIPGFRTSKKLNTNFELQFTRQSLKFSGLYDGLNPVPDLKVTGNYLRFLPTFEITLFSDLDLFFGPEMSFLISENTKRGSVRFEATSKPFFADLTIGLGSGIKYSFRRLFVSGRYSHTISKETTFKFPDNQGNQIEDLLNKSRNFQIGIGYRLI